MQLLARTQIFSLRRLHVPPLSPYQASTFRSLRLLLVLLPPHHPLVTAYVSGPYVDLWWHWLWLCDGINCVGLILFFSLAT